MFAVVTGKKQTFYFRVISRYRFTQFILKQYKHYHRMWLRAISSNCMHDICCVHELISVIHYLTSQQILRPSGQEGSMSLSSQLQFECILTYQGCSCHCIPHVCFTPNNLTPQSYTTFFTSTAFILRAHRAQTHIPSCNCVYSVMSPAACGQ